MHLKWFRGKAVPEVMSQIREELGPEAVILHSKQSRPRGPLGMMRGGGVEILAAIDYPTGPSAGQETDAPAAPAARHGDSLRAEVAALKHLMLQFGGARVLPPALAPYYECLVSAGVEPPLAVRLLSSVAAPSGDESPDADDPIQDALAGMIPTQGAEAQGAHGRVALVGPAGAGKTTTLAKLAARAQIGGSRAAILNLDEGGFSTQCPLESLAAILDVPYASADSAEEVTRQVRRASAGEIMLIDTPGLGVGDDAALDRLGGLLASADAREVHLVLPATTKTADALAVFRALSRLHPSHLLFTRLDQTTSCGSVLAVSVETGLPLSYFGTGREIPGDLAPATAGALVHRIFTQRGHIA